jgi:hypothetical protein
MSQRSMVPVLIFGGLVLAAGAGLWLMLRSGDDAAATPTGEAITATESPSTPTDRSGSAPTVTPTLPGETRTAPASEVKEYVVGDRRVRDHRSGDRAPIDIPPAVHPAESRRIASNLTHEIGQKLKVMVKECSAALPAAARGRSSRLEGKVVISIHAKQVTVKEAVVQLREITDASVDTIKKCIEDKALTVTQETDEPDLESYDINLSYAL